MEALTLATLAALVKKLVDAGKYSAGGDWKALRTQAFTWAAGVVAVLAFCRSDFAAAELVGGYALADLNIWSQVLIGLGISSTASVTDDGFKSIQKAGKQAPVEARPASTSVTVDPARLRDIAQSGGGVGFRERARLRPLHVDGGTHDDYMARHQEALRAHDKPRQGDGETGR